MPIMKNNKLFAFFIMHAGFLIYSLYTVLGKFAARYDTLSLNWCLFYAGIIGVLGIYAVLWQQVLKAFSLPVAMCNKAITIVWGMAFSRILFSEEITLKKIAGALIILGGIILLSTAKSESEK